MHKRLLSIVLVLALCLAYVPVMAYADTVTQLTVYGPDQKNIEGYLISNSVNSSAINISGNGSGGYMFDGWSLEIDGTEHYQSDADFSSLTWSSSSSYKLIIPISVEGDVLDPDNLTATYNGDNATSWLKNIGAYGATLEVPLYVADQIASVTTEPTAKEGLTYKGSAQALLNAGSTNDGTMQYKLMSSAAEWSNTIPTATNVGTYEILWRVKGDETHFDYEEPTPIMVEIGKGNAVVKADDISKTVGETDPALTATVTGVYGSDTLSYTLVRESGEEIGTYAIVPAGDTDQGNYTVSYENGTFTIEEENFSYDFEQPETGVGSGKVNKNSWTWGERANLPIDVAKLYTVLVNNSEEDEFLADDETWALPAVDPTGITYNVVEALECEDHEPEYFAAAGSTSVDQNTFGKSDFFIVGVGTGDTKIDYPNLKTGDVVSNTKFNGVYITKLQKTGNTTFDADLAKLKSDCIASFRAFELDHPEVFWLNGSVKLRVLTVTLSGVQTSYLFMTLVDDSGFTMRITEYAAAGAIETAIQQRDKAVETILAQIPEGAKPRQVIANLNKWFTLHNEYNRSADLSKIGYTPHRSLKALVGNSGTNGPVCDGYSRAVKVICDKLGIPAILDTGMASSGSHSEYHMWNRIKIDNVWYGFDCTWDDPIVKGKNGVVSGYENENFLLVGKDTVINGAKFGVSHPVNDTAGGTTGVLFAGLTVNPEAIEGYLVMPFTDVRLGDWFYDQVKAAYSNNIVTGMTKTTYVPNLPDGQLKHGQIMVIVANLHSKQKDDNFKGFSVPGDHWAASFRDYCKKEGIIDDRFDDVLDKPVTRAEMSYYFANCLTSSSYKNKKSVSLSDIADETYKAEITKLAKADIVGGFPDGTFRPGELVTRAQAAVFIANILDAIGN
jgi:hypothetical protein